MTDTDRAYPVIWSRGLTRAFGDLVAVRDLTVSVEAGTILGLIGPSGSGKTTTIRMLTGTLAPTAGELRVLGENPLRFSRQARAQIAYMPQLFSLYPDLTVSENVGFVAALFGIGFIRRGRLVRRALEIVDLWQQRNRLARNLSGGMQRRLELACALVHSPNVLFVDEPTAGVDPMLRQSLWGEFRRLRDAGRTLLLTTQYVADAEYCDRVALQADGELVALEDPQTLRRLAFGGEVLEVDTLADVDPTMLESVRGLLSVRNESPRRMIVVARDAALTTPRIVEALHGRGVEVAQLAEHQPDFDEVFTRLVEQRRRAREEPVAHAA